MNNFIYKIFGLGLGAIHNKRYIKINLMTLAGNRVRTIQFDISDTATVSDIMTQLSARVVCDIDKITISDHVRFSDVGINS